MQRPHRISLNAVRVFIIAAQSRSIALAAETLAVTPGAVSHQIRRLESELGVKLFDRRNNSIALTAVGSLLLEESAPALATVERAVGRLQGNANEIVIRVSMSLGIRWLIPALERFKKIHPTARVRIETTNTQKLAPGDPSDIAIYYERMAGAGPGEVIAIDLARPVLSPERLRTSGYSNSGNLRDVPALSCTSSNWDWAYWAAKHGIMDQDIVLADGFDTDDAAIRAAEAGLGMVLSTTFLTARELEAGTLVALPGFAPVQLGSYKMVMHSQPSRMAENFRTWLRQEISSVAASGSS